MSAEPGHEDHLQIDLMHGFGSRRYGIECGVLSHMPQGLETIQGIAGTDGRFDGACIEDQPHRFATKARQRQDSVDLGASSTERLEFAIEPLQAIVAVSQHTGSFEGFSSSGVEHLLLQFRQDLGVFSA